MVINMSKDITCTKERAVAMIAYRDCDSSPTIVKKIFPNNIKIKWYKIMESRLSNINMEGPQIKVCEKANWQEYRRARKIGTKLVVGRGIKNVSLVTSLTKSNAIWKAPFLPINMGPTLLIAYASSFRSTRTTNKVKRTEKRAKI
jgi:hypothetical protein